MHLRPLLSFVCALVAATALTTPAVAKPKVAVLGLEVVGKGATDAKTVDAAKSLTRELRREADSDASPFALAPNSNRDLLEIKMLSDCSDEGKTCMSEVGTQLGAERLIYGKLERKKGGRYEISLSLLNVEAVELENQHSGTITSADMSKEDRLAARAGELFRGVVGVQEGVLAISSNAEAGTVYVDGEIRTTLSAGEAQVSGLSVGQHDIAIEADGFARSEFEVSIAAGEIAILNASLVAGGGGADFGPGSDTDVEEDGGSNGWRVAFWSGAVATGVTGAGFMVSFFAISQAELDLNDATTAYGQDGQGTVAADSDGFYTDACKSFSGGPSSSESMENATAWRQINDACSRGKRWSTLSKVFGYSTLAFGVVTAVAGYMGYVRDGDDARERRSARGEGNDRRSVTITPALGPDLVGAGLEILF